MEAPQAGTYKLVRELGSREVPTFAARLLKPPGSEGRLVVLERTSAAPTEEQELQEAARRVRSRVTLEHRSLGRVLEVTTSPGQVLVASEYVDGETLGALTARKRAPPFPFRMRLRMLLDVLAGLEALHAHGGAGEHAHGAVSPDNVVIGTDGVARLVRVGNLFPTDVSPASPTLGYVAPEVVGSGARAPIGRIDLYGVGVMLWETLAGKRLAIQTNIPALLLQEFASRPPRGVPVEDAAWSKALIAVTERAMATPEERFGDAAAMTAALRAIVGDELPPARDVGEHVKVTSAVRIEERRSELETMLPSAVALPRASTFPSQRIPADGPPAIVAPPPTAASPRRPGPSPRAPAAATMADDERAPASLANLVAAATAAAPPESTRPAPAPRAKAPPPDITVPDVAAAAAEAGAAAPRAAPAVPPLVADDTVVNILPPVGAPRRWRALGGLAGLLVVAGLFFWFVRQRTPDATAAPATTVAPPATASAAPATAAAVGSTEELPQETAGTPESPPSEIELPDTPAAPRARTRRRRPPPTAASAGRHKFDPQGI